MSKIQEFERSFSKNIYKSIIFGTINFLSFFIKNYYAILQRGKFKNWIFFNFFIIYGISAILFAVLDTLPHKIKKVAETILWISTIFISLIEILLWVSLKEALSSTYIRIIMETNLNESVGFFKMYTDTKVVLAFVISIILIFLVKKFLYKDNIHHISNKIISVFIILVIGVIIRDIIRNYNKRLKIESITDRMQITRVIRQTENAMDDIKQADDLKIELDKRKINITAADQKFDNVVLIINESVTKNHMSMYGYDKQTTPLLEKEKNIFKFSDIISPNFQTIASLEKVMTYKSNENKDDWYTYPDIITILKRSGYETYWISNQENGGRNMNLGVAFSTMADNSKFLKNRSFMDGYMGGYDEELIDEYNKLAPKNKNKKFVIFHLIGAHAPYRDRYPDKYDVFPASEYANIQRNDPSDIDYIRHYDDAILYNDFVVDSIIKQFQDKNSVVIMFSDHGEEVYDYRDFKGHGAKLSRYQVEIPFLIYLSDIAAQNDPELVEKIKSSLNKPYSTENFIHTFMDITGVHEVGYDESKSILSPHYDTQTKRKTENVDYDKELKGKN